MFDQEREIAKYASAPKLHSRDITRPPGLSPSRSASRSLPIMPRTSSSWFHVHHALIRENANLRFRVAWNFFGVDDRSCEREIGGESAQVSLRCPFAFSKLSSSSSIIEAILRFARDGIDWRDAPSAWNSNYNSSVMIPRARTRTCAGTSYRSTKKAEAIMPLRLPR